MTQIRVALADDHPVVLAGVKALLQEAPEILLVGEATTGSAALHLIRDTMPDVAVIDISMPDMNGVDLAKRVATSCPEVKLLVLTVHEDRAYVQQLLEAGTRGYLLKRSAAEDLVRAIRAVASGGVYLDPAVADRALTNAARRGVEMSPSGSQESLSQREAVVLKLMAQGYSNKEIAAQLSVSVKTIETYKARAAEKLDLRTRADIVRYGASQGWLAELDRT